MPLTFNKLLQIIAFGYLLSCAKFINVLDFIFIQPTHRFYEFLCFLDNLPQS